LEGKERKKVDKGSLESGGGRKKAGGQLEDDPRKLGKDRIRLVGSVPRKSGRKAGWRRQYSPAPLAAFARRQ
jgi:hypothetical protein